MKKKRAPEQLVLSVQLELPLRSGEGQLWASVDSFPKRAAEAIRARKKRVTRKMSQPDLLLGREGKDDG